MGGGQRFVYAKEFNGAPKPENFRLEKYELPDLKENGNLIQLIARRLQKCIIIKFAIYRISMFC